VVGMPSVRGMSVLVRVRVRVGHQLTVGSGGIRARSA
jgi:hypothetical protein